MGFASSWHWLILLVVVLLLFGNRLPSVMRSLGQGVTEFKKGMDGLGRDNDEEEEDEEEPRPKKKKKAVTAEVENEDEVKA